jgi:hypothetical protein
VQRKRIQNDCFYVPFFPFSFLAFIKVHVLYIINNKKRLNCERFRVSAIVYINLHLKYNIIIIEVTKYSFCSVTTKKNKKIFLLSLFFASTAKAQFFFFVKFVKI